MLDIKSFIKMSSSKHYLSTVKMIVEYQLGLRKLRGRRLLPSNVQLHNAEPEPIYQNISMLYYVKISREEAEEILLNYIDTNGVFLIRSCSIGPECSALPFVYNLSVHNGLIFIRKTGRNSKASVEWVLNGERRGFGGLLQLIQFYQENMTVLPTKLTYFVLREQISTW